MAVVKFILVTGGTVEGPETQWPSSAGGWDFQLTYATSRRMELHRLKAADGTTIHVLTNATFVTTLEVVPKGQAVRPCFYQVK